jgi:hypothetical protein
MPAQTLAMPPVPRQFALVLDVDDERYGEFVDCCRPAGPVVWWGCQLDGHAMLYRIGEDGRFDTGHHADAEDALALWRRMYPLKLVWL